MIRRIVLFALTASFLSAQEATVIQEYEVIQDKATLPILTPALEDRKVEKLRLQNGLKVYLVSDPGVDQSAAGLCVEAGSWEDPKEYPGMAHFLEHMLFMGTAAYPNEFEYMQFINDHGGTVNAFTACDRTVYMFSVNNDAFDLALDRFSHFFIDPLLSPNCIDRELHAVDQEHSKNIEHDGWRQYMILKESSNPQHPHSAFSTGNAKTLSGIPQSALRNWYQTHYSADRMHLVMISSLPLEEMRALALQDFSKVPEGKRTASKQLSGEISSSKQRGHILFIKPVKDIKQLSLSWEVPVAFAQDTTYNAPELVAQALNGQGEHSLAQVLKAENIAESVHVNCDRLSKQSLFFSIDVSLTEEGLSHTDTAITRIFEAIARLKKERFPAFLFEEYKKIAMLNYQFQSREDAFTTVMELAAGMPYEDLSTYPEQTRIPLKFDAEFVCAFIDTLRAEKCIYSVLADPTKTGITMDIKEKWMQAEYAIKPVSKAHLTAWNNMGPNEAIQIPKENPYIPNHLGLVEVNESQSQPILLCSDEGSTIYYAPDTSYQVPEISFLFNLQSPWITNKASSQVLLDLYVRALTEQLSPELSLASNAGLSAQFDTEDFKLNIHLNGYNDKAALLIDQIFASLKKVSVSEEKFKIYQMSLISDYDNASKELPLHQAMQQLDAILFDAPTQADKYKAIQTVTYADFVEFSKALCERTYVEGLLYGNLTSQDAHTLWHRLKNTLNSEPFALSEHFTKKVLVLSEKSGPSKLVQSTDRQGSGALLLLQEGPFSFENRAIQQVLGYALSDAFFDTLRTKQQTAYIAKAWNAEEERQLMQYFAVQSSTHTPTDLLARFELFLESFDKNLNIHIPEGRFESIRASLITLLKMPPENMAGMAHRLDQLAFEYYDFKWFDKRIESLQEISYEQFLKTSHKLLSRNNTRRLAILMEGTMHPDNDFRYEQISKEEVNNLGSFFSIR